MSHTPAAERTAGVFYANEWDRTGDAISHATYTHSMFRVRFMSSYYICEHQRRRNGGDDGSDGDGAAGAGAGSSCSKSMSSKPFIEWHRWMLLLLVCSAFRFRSLISCISNERVESSGRCETMLCVSIQSFTLDCFSLV